MNGAINFTYTFSHGIEWHWPIALYLLLAGMSGGALVVSLLIRFYKKQSESTPLFKAASLLSLVTILLGMVCLVGDLEKPLYFWKILINYNFKSVMSIGVAALCIYIPLSFVMVLYAFEREITESGIFERVGKFDLPRRFECVMRVLNAFRPLAYSLTLVFAVAICAYTGFLISVLVRFPLLNTAVLPALFVASGLSAGIAGASIVAAFYFKADTHSGDIKILHAVEWPVLAFEILLILMIFVSLVIGSDVQKAASVAFYQGYYARMFWIGVVLIGFGVPLALNFGLGRFITHPKFSAFYISAFASIFGVFMLRMFILYAGQTYDILHI